MSCCFICTGLQGLAAQYVFYGAQFRTSFLASVFIMVSVLLLWFIKENNCFSAAFTWYGLMSCQVRERLA